MEKQQQIAVVTGSSTGIGYETSLLLARNGFYTFATMRAMSGIIGIPATSAYASTKFALEGLSESISYELEPYGIKIILIEPGVINTNFVPNIKLPTLINNKSQQAQSKEKESVIDYSDNDIKKENYSHYSSTMETFLSHYYPAMKSAPLPEEAAAIILESIKNVINSSECLFRYTVGKDAKTFSQAKKEMSDSQLHKFVSDRLLS